MRQGESVLRVLTNLCIPHALGQALLEEAAPLQHPEPLNRPWAATAGLHRHLVSMRRWWRSLLLLPCARVVFDMPCSGFRVLAPGCQLWLLTSARHISTDEPSVDECAVMLAGVSCLLSFCSLDSGNGACRR